MVDRMQKNILGKEKKMVKGEEANLKNKKKKHEKEWNHYLTDDDKFKLSKEEMIRRKTLFISKHNVLTSSPSALLNAKSTIRSGKRRIVRQRSIPQTKQKPKHTSRQDNSSSILDEVKHETSLDLLNSDENSYDHDDCHSTLDGSVGSEQDSRKASRTAQLRVNRRQRKYANINESKRASMRCVNSSSTLTSSGPKSVIKDRNKSESCATQHERRSETNERKPVYVPEKDLSLSQKEMNDIGAMIDALSDEVAYYEQLSGRKSVIDTEELKMITSVDGSSNWSDRSPVTVMRYLVHLVCQSMSYLLQGEVERASQKKDIDELHSKVDTLLTLNSYKGLSSESPTSKGNSEAPSTPKSHRTTDNMPTPPTDRTLDLYGSSSVHLSTQSQTSEETDERTYVQERNSNESLRENEENNASLDIYSAPHKVRFNLDSDSTGTSKKSPLPNEERYMVGPGTATTDWLFGPDVGNFSHKCNVDNEEDSNESVKNTDTKQSGSAYHQARLDADNLGRDSSTEMFVQHHMTPPNPPVTANARVRELQRQLAMLRHQRNEAESSNLDIEKSSEHKHSMYLARSLSSSSPDVSPAEVNFSHYQDSQHGSNSFPSRSKLNNDYDEIASFSSIPSGMLPVPEREPSHPFSETKRPFAFRDGLTQQFSTPTKNKPAVYDARQGSFSSN